MTENMTNVTLAITTSLPLSKTVFLKPKPTILQHVTEMHVLSRISSYHITSSYEVG